MGKRKPDVCNGCGEPLLLGQNWLASRAKHHIKMCCRCNTVAKKARNYSLPSRYSALKLRAKKLGVLFTLSREDFASIALRPCVYCGTEPRETAGSWLDQAEAGGGYSTGNAVPCCGRCNKVKNDHITYDEMIRFIAPALRAVDAERKLHAPAADDQPGPPVLRDGGPAATPEQSRETAVVCHASRT